MAISSTRGLDAGRATDRRVVEAGDDQVAATATSAAAAAIRAKVRAPVRRRTLFKVGL
jgi:hypothetical protein